MFSFPTIVSRAQVEAADSFSANSFRFSFTAKVQTDVRKIGAYWAAPRILTAAVPSLSLALKAVRSRVGYFTGPDFRRAFDYIGQRCNDFLVSSAFIGLGIFPGVPYADACSFSAVLVYKGDFVLKSLLASEQGYDLILKLYRQDTIQLRICQNISVCPIRTHSRIPRCQYLQAIPPYRHLGH